MECLCQDRFKSLSWIVRRNEKRFEEWEEGDYIDDQASSGWCGSQLTDRRRDGRTLANKNDVIGAVTAVELREGTTRPALSSDTLTTSIARRACMMYDVDL